MKTNSMKEVVKKTNLSLSTLKRIKKQAKEEGIYNNEEKRQFSKCKWVMYAFIFVLVLLILVGIPAVYNHIILTENPSNPSYDGWLGFWEVI
ncbi:MAG: hypothetical protein ACLS8D_06225 [Clostridioides difficile]